MASRAFGKSEINAVTTRIKVAQDLGNDGIKKVSETRADIESAINEAIKPEWARVLHGIPVDEINSDKSGIRVNVLKEAGYTDVYSIYAASQQNLASVNGIGEVMSLRAKENATKIATDVWTISRTNTRAWLRLLPSICVPKKTFPNARLFWP